MIYKVKLKGRQYISQRSDFRKINQNEQNAYIRLLVIEKIIITYGCVNVLNRKVMGKEVTQSQLDSLYGDIFKMQEELQRLKEMQYIYLQKNLIK
ncbi:MAG: hypothetical protein LBJ93_02735 [Clostridiales bacterium]|jgi:hypothetical protein|nr:hypothetical protein [Clostridiales bacterium]